MSINLEVANSAAVIDIDRWGDYGRVWEDYLEQDANIPLKTKKGSVIDILLWAIFWLHLR